MATVKEIYKAKRAEINQRLKKLILHLANTQENLNKMKLIGDILEI